MKATSCSGWGQIKPLFLLDRNSGRKPSNSPKRPQYHPKGLLKISILNMRTLALKVDYWLYRVSYIEAWEEVCDPAILRGKSSSMEKRLQLKLC